MADGGRALRFSHPDLDVGPPGLQVDDHGRLATVDERRSIRQGLLLLLTTRPGDRLLRPDYGSDLSRLVFAPNDDNTAGLAIHYVTRAVRRWEPRIEIADCDAGADAERSSLVVTLTYRLRATGDLDALTVSVPLREAAAP